MLEVNNEEEIFSKDYQKEKKWLEDYASKNNIKNLTSEEIIKLHEKPFIVSEIIDAFNITKKDYEKIRKCVGISNINLERAIRNIDVILYSIDLKDRYVSNKIRKMIVNMLIPAICNKLPKSEFYINQLSLIEFSREYVQTDIIKRNIDIDYRLEKMDYIINKVDLIVEEMLKKEKNKLLNYNSKQQYNELLNQKKNGKNFNKENLTYEILYELSIIEGISDTLIGMIFNMKRDQVRNLRKKVGLFNKQKTKLIDYPELLIYYIEENGKRDKNISNYELEKEMNTYIQNEYGIKLESKENDNIETITIDIDNKNISFKVKQSKEIYNINKSSSHKYSKGSHHNYKKENQNKSRNGKIGEKIALEYEKNRLKKIGLEKYINQVKLVSQINEDVTFDGLGYDLISINENKELIFIEVKTSFSKKDRPIFISKKEMEMMKGYISEFDCKHCFIYYVLVDGENVSVKEIKCDNFNNYRLEPVLYKITGTNSF